MAVYVSCRAGHPRVASLAPAEKVKCDMKVAQHAKR